MSEVTAPIMTDATGQSIDSKLNSLLGKMDNLAAAFQPNASGIVYSNTTSGLTGDDVQEAIDEMAADVSEIKQSLSYYKDYTVTLSANSYVSPFTHLGTQNINGNLDGHTNYKITSILLLGGNSTQMGTVVYKGEGTSGDYINVYGNAAISMTIRVNYILT